MISLISCLLSPPFISLLFIYLHFAHTYSSGSTSFEHLSRAPAKSTSAVELFHSICFSHENQVSVEFSDGMCLSPFDVFFWKGWRSLIKRNDWRRFDWFYFDISPKLKTDSSFIKNNHTNGGPIRGSKWQHTWWCRYWFGTYQIKFTQSINCLTLVFACTATTKQASLHCSFF